MLIVGGWALPALDFVALAAGFGCAVLLSAGGGGRFVLAVFPFLGVLVMAARGAYGLRLRLIVLDSLVLAAGSISVAAMGALAVGLLVRSSDPGAAVLFRAWLLGIVFVGLARSVFVLWQQRLRVAGETARRTVVIGAGDVGARIGRRLECSPAYGLRPVGYLDDDPPPAAAVGVVRRRCWGRCTSWLGLVEAHEVEHVILAFSGTSDGQLLPLLRRCVARGVGVSVVPRLFDLVNDRLAYEPVGGLPVGDAARD